MNRRNVAVEKVSWAFGFLLACVLLLTVMTPLYIWAQDTRNDKSESTIINKYRQLIPELMAEQNIQGIAVAVVDENGVLWTEGFGFTDDDRKTAVTSETIFSVQSTSKTFTATAVMLGVQDGLLELDDPITKYLPDFTVHSIFEEHPERKITLRMLLSHTAGFTHEAPLGNNFDLGSVSFDDHIKTISDTWLRFPVGTSYAYSNLGVDLAGYILQEVSGVPFEKYVEEKLLKQISMSNSSFDMDTIRANTNRAVGHSRPYRKVPLEIPMIPSGGFYTSANDMAKFIQFQLNRGSVKGQDMLSHDLLDEMYTVPAPAYGSTVGYALGIALMSWHQGREAVLFQHGGGGFGFISDLWWLPELKIGITVLTNSTSHTIQGTLASQILYDFVHDPNSVYYPRMMALPDRLSVAEGGGQLPPPDRWAKVIEQHGLKPTDHDQVRWKEYEGRYDAEVWGRLSLFNTFARVYSHDSHLFIKTNEAPNELKLVEVSPGLFFAENGEALDFRGSIPTWRNIKLTRLGLSAFSWQQIILAAFALIFLFGLLFFPLRILICRFCNTRHTHIRRVDG